MNNRAFWTNHHTWIIMKFLDPHCSFSSTELTGCAKLGAVAVLEAFIGQ